MSSTEPLTTGSLIDGRYRVDEVIGEGGFGRVYRGQHLVLESPIAVKTLRLDLGRDQAEQSLRFLDEARLLSKLRHPNIVRVIDAGVHPSTPPQGWLVIEWCDGVTLAEDLARSTGATRSVREVWGLLGPLVDAVATAHEADIVHRDLKPSNVMITKGPRGPEARLIDFGIAKAISQGEETPSESRTSGRVAFTIAYAAPEQIAGTRTGPWTDVHALGLLLTEVLTGSPPYPRGEELHGVLDASRRPTPRALGVDVGAWEEVLARAVAFKGSDRYPSARDLHGALQRALPDLAHDRTASPSTSPHPSAPAPRSGASRSAGGTERETAVSAHSDRASGGSLDGPATITSAASSRELATSPTPREPTFGLRGRALGAALVLGLAATAGVVWLSRDDDAPSNAASSTPISTPTATTEASSTEVASTRPEVTSATTAQETATAQASATSATSTTATSARADRTVAPPTMGPAASTATSSTATATAHTTAAPSITPSASTARPTLQ